MNYSSHNYSLDRFFRNDSYRWVTILGFAGIYFGLGFLSLRLSFDGSNATPVWLPSGFAFAVILMYGLRLAPAIFLGAVSINLIFLYHSAGSLTAPILFVSLLTGIGNTAEAVVGYLLLKKILPDLDVFGLFDRVRNVFTFVFVSFAMTLTSSFVGAAGSWIVGLISIQQYLSVWFTWWIGDITSILLVTPILLVWTSKNSHMRAIRRAELTEQVLCILGAVGITLVVFLGWSNDYLLFTNAFVVIPFVIWAAMRLHLRVLTLIFGVITLIATVGAVKHAGAFASSDVNESLITVGVFLALNVVMGLLLYAANSERSLKEDLLEHNNRQLENVVNSRTKELREKNQELETRNQELASFNFAATHDLQEPLRKIYVFSNKILESEILSVSAMDLFRRIQRSTDRMKRLLDDLLFYSTVVSNHQKKELVDLNQVLSEVLEERHDGIMNSKAIIETDRLPTILGIKSQFYQLFSNIISNSLKFRSPDRQLVIKIVSDVQTNNEVIANVDSQQPLTHISFSDNGIGFDQKYASVVFDLFQRLHGQVEFPGTGLGLAICKKIVEWHHGYIYASSESGKGTTIHIHLPDERSTSRWNADSKEDGLVEIQGV